MPDKEEDCPLVFIIDDDEALQETLALRLEVSGFRVARAFSGEDAFLKLKNTIPDIILLDVTMPKMDGFEVCKVLKENEDTQNIPVIFLTAAGTNMEAQLQSLMVGAVDYIPKPYEGNELVERIRQHLNQK
jgi:DNA-binding response OmpR family regulator